MKCEEVQILIEDFIDSALDQKAAAVLKAHMTGCVACSSFYREVNREQEIYARYERDIEVTPALWASIEKRIKQGPISAPPGLMSRLREQLAGMFAGPRLSPAFAAALIIVAIGITIAVMTYLNPRGNSGKVAVENGKPPAPPEVEKPPAPPEPGKESQNVPDLANGGDEHVTPRITTPKGTIPRKNLNATAKLTPEQLVRDAEQKYLTAISMLSREVNGQRSQLDPIMLARLDASLSEIDRTIAETRRVVRENPGDPIALQYLLAAYSKKVEVLRGMTTD